MYKIHISKLDSVQIIIRLADNSFIPMDESNTDYQEYLKWVSEGNTPEAADE
jgi:hypothetical protein